MARRRPDGGDRGGGESIQAPRPRHARLATGALALAAAAALAAYPAVEDIPLHLVAVALGAAALVLLAGGLALRWPTPIGWGVAALGGEYAVHFAAHGRALDELTPAYAAGFMLTAELAYWSVERRIAAWSDAAVLTRRLVHLAGSCAGAAVLAALIVVLASASRGGGVALEAAGVAGAIGALALVAGLVRRSLSAVDSLT